jgi:2-polyprenyl-6-methoxyphenol hydroxylase-like FAD-dependent oxidoreductase
MKRFDAVVIGGGPAGSLTALRLARAGWGVGLIEKGPRHRHKTCGHCLHARSFQALERAGVLHQIRASAVGSTATVVVRDEVSRCVRSHFANANDLNRGLVISRQTLDQLLIDRAAELGAEVFQESMARLVLTEKPCAMVAVRSDGKSFRVRTPLVIGADGVGSGVARAAGLASPESAGRNFGCSFSMAMHAAAEEIPAQTIAMFLAADGYLGVVRESNCRLHVAMRIGAAGTPDRRNPLGFVHAVAWRFPVLQAMGMHCLSRDHVHNFCAVGPIPWRPRRLANPRVALVGDAAGYIEPFTGEGMTWALTSAETLCNVLETCGPGRWDAACIEEYVDSWKREVGRRHWLCRAVATALASRRITGLCMRAAGRVPAMTDRVVRMVVAA